MRYNPNVFSIEEFNPQTDGEPYWEDIANEREVFRTTFNLQRPLVLKGPTGCGKTTLARRMQWELGNELKNEKYSPDFSFNEESGLYEPITGKKAGSASLATNPAFPLYVVDGNEDTEVIHLVGGYNAIGKFVGGPLYHWAHTGGILLVNEFAEIRGDVQTVFHGALDKERLITFPDVAKLVNLPDHAMFVATYNPGYQAKRNPLKISTKQRLPGINFDYPTADQEAKIVYNASAVNGTMVGQETAERLAKLAEDIRGKDKEKSFLSSREGISTRLLVMAAEYMNAGLTPKVACQTAIVEPLASNDKERETLEVIISAHGFK